MAQAVRWLGSNAVTACRQSFSPLSRKGEGLYCPLWILPFGAALTAHRRTSTRV
jgi:hypothetical protein